MKYFRQTIAAGLSVLMILLSPGLECYQAFGAEYSSRARFSPRAGKVEIPVVKLSGIDMRWQAGAGRRVVPSARVPLPAAAAGLAQEPAPARDDVQVPLAAEPDSSSFQAASPREAERIGVVRRIVTEVKARFGWKTLIVPALALSLVAGPAVTQAPAQYESGDDEADAAAPATPAPAARPRLQKKAATLESTVAVEDKSVEIGGTVTVTLKLKNTAAEPQKLADLRESLVKAAPRSIAVRAVSPVPETLAPGQEITVTVEVQVLGIPAGKSEKVAVAPINVVAGNAAFTLPAFEIGFNTVLNADWKDGGFHPLKDPLVKKKWDASWLLAIPTALLGWFTSRRLLRQKSAVGSAAARPRSAESLAQDALDKLATASSAKEFYTGLTAALERYLSDEFELPRHKGRTPQMLLTAARKSGRLTPEEKESLKLLIEERADPAAFGGRDIPAEQRSLDLSFARSLVAKLSNAVAAPAGATKLMNNIAPLALLLPAGWELGAPALLLVHLVFLGVAWKLWRDSREPRAAVLAPALSRMPQGKTLRQRLRWIPNTLVAAGAVLAVFAAADPRAGAVLTKMLVPVVKVISAIDNSPSMDSPMNGGSGITKSAASVAGEKVFIADQRKGARNQLGVVVWNTQVTVISPLTVDLSAAEASLSRITTTGGTNAELAIQTVINMFLKRNIVEIDEEVHPEANELKRLMRTKGLVAALEVFFAKEKKGSPLWNLVVRPDQAKIIRLSTDGDSTGNPIAGGYLAKALGVIIHPIEMPAGDSKPAVLKKIAETTGGQYAKADDAQGLADIQLAISKAIKTPVPVLVASQKSLQGEISGWVFWMMALGGLLANLRLRIKAKVLAALAFAGYALAAPLAQAQQALNPHAVISELEEGRRLNREGQHMRAIQKFLAALDKNPQLAEIRFDIGTAFLGLKEPDVAHAEPFLRESLEMARKTGDPILEGKTLYQLALASLLDEDAQGADLLLRQALAVLVNSPDIETKQNAERLQRMIAEQKQKDEKDQKDQKNKKKQKGKKPSSEQQQRAKERSKGQKGAGGPGQGKSSGQEAGEDKADKAELSQDEIAKKLGSAQKKQEPGPASPSTFGKVWSVAGALGLGSALLGGLPGFAEAAGPGGAATWGWERPEYLIYTALLLPLIAAFAAFRVWRSYRNAKETAPGLTAATIGQSALTRREFFKQPALCAGITCAGAAKAGPWSDFKEVLTDFGGGRRDVGIVVGVSNSDVHAVDGRFDRVVTGLEQYLKAMENPKSNRLDRVAIVPVAEEAGEGRLTTDYMALRERLYDLRSESFRFAGGSVLAKGILRMLQVFKDAEHIGEPERIILLVSDGGDIMPADISEEAAKASPELAQARELSEALKLAVKEGVRIYTIGSGSAIPVKMQVPDEVLAKNPALPKFIKATDKSQKRDGEGNVLVGLNQAVLDKIARATGGEPLLAESGYGLDKALRAVAGHERARSKTAATETVKVENSLRSRFLIPGALFAAAYLILEARSALSSQNRLNGLGPLALFFLGIVPVTAGVGLFFSLSITALLGFWFLDTIRGGQPSRRLMSWLQVRSGILERALRQDAAALFIGATGRAFEARRLEEFLEQWQAAGRSWRRSRVAAAREQLLAAVDSRDDLWREKLIAVYLYENAPALREKIKAKIGELDQGGLDAANATLRMVLVKRGQAGAAGPPFAWLRSDAVTARLVGMFSREDLGDPTARAFFEEISEGPNAALRAEARKALELSEPVARFSWWRRQLKTLPAAALAGVLLISSVGFNGFAGHKILELQVQGREAQTEMSQKFFGNDAYILTQPYQDARIQEQVIPLLKEWRTFDGARNARRIDKALEVLTLKDSSTDDKAAGVMLFLFRQRVVYGLNADQQKLIIKFLLERNNEELLSGLVADMAKKPSPAAKERYDFAVSILGALKGNKNYVMLVSLLSDENPAVSRPAYAAILKALAEHKDEQSALLKMSLEKQGSDPGIRLGHVGLALDLLATKTDPKEISGLAQILTAAMTLHDKNTKAEEIEESLEYRQQALAILTQYLAGHKELKENPQLRELFWGIVSEAARKTLETGEAAAGADKFVPLAMRNGLRTAAVSAKNLYQNGRVVIPSGAEFSTVDDYLQRFHLNQLLRALELLAGQAAKTAGADQLEWGAEKPAAFIKNAPPALEAVIALAKALELPDAPAADSTSTLIDSFATVIVNSLISPFKDQSWNEFLKESVDKQNAQRFSRPDLLKLLPLMEKVAASGKLEVASRVSSNTAPLSDNEKKVLAGALAQLRPLLAGDAGAAINGLLGHIGAEAVSELDSPFSGQTWKEFITGSTSGDFKEILSRKELEGVLARMEKVAAVGGFKVPSRTESKLSDTEKEKLKASIAKIRSVMAEMRRLETAPLFLVKPAAKTPAAGVKLRSPGLAALGVFGLMFGSVEPIILTITLAAMLAAAVWAFFGLGLHKPPRPKAAAAPTTAQIEQRFGDLELPAKAIADSLMSGALRSRAKGPDGMDNIDSLPREPGQTPGRKDYIATKRTGVVHDWVFEQERDMPVMLFVKINSWLDAGGQEVSKRRVVADAVGAIALAASQYRSVGLVLYTDRVEKIVAPRSGRNAAFELFSELYSFHPAGSGSDLKAALQAYIGDQGAAKSMLVPVSDFLTEREGYGPVLAEASAAGHVVMPIVVEDPFDGKPIPDLGIQRLKDAATGVVRQIDTSNAAVRRAQQAQIERARGQREQFFSQAEALTLRLTTNGRHLDELIAQSRHQSIPGDAYGN